MATIALTTGSPERGAAWLGPALLAAMVAAALLARQGEALMLLFPVAALAVGFQLYLRHPAGYLGFVWWLWFLAPELRRLVDFQTGWHAQNPVMLAPYLVTGLSALTALRRGRPCGSLLPFVAIGLGLFYAFAVGMFRVGPVAAAFDMLTWGVPVALALHLLKTPEHFPCYRHVCERTFVWAVGLLGLYGLVQFFWVPPWDAHWMRHVPMTSIGSPAPFEVRVFSTLNAPGPFALVMGAGLLVLFGGTSRVRWLAAPLGLASFLLSQVRAAWGGWVLALGIMVLRANGRTRARLALALGAGLLLAWPVMTQEPLASVIGGRLETIAVLREDMSFNERTQLYQAYADAALFNPVGEGLGSLGLATKLAEGQRLLDFDSGLLGTLLVLGWPGTLLYMLGLGMLLCRRTGRDAFSTTAWAIALSSLAQMLFANSLIGLGGVVLWGFLALSLIGRDAAPSPPR